MKHRDRIWSASAFVIGAATASLTPASATPASGFVATPVASGDFRSALDVKADKLEHWDLTLTTKDETLTGINKVTVQSGGHSGWHSHPIPILLTVTVGEIQWYDGSDPICGWKTYHVGDSKCDRVCRGILCSAHQPGKHQLFRRPAQAKQLSVLIAY